MKPLHLAIMKPVAKRLSPAKETGKKPTARLQEIAEFGSNPGALRAWAHVPAELSAGSPLVVVLHGCTQSAADYDIGAGWSQLGDELGFAVLVAEQQRANNPNLCFNWFSPIDSRRDSGEALSIRQMVAWMTATYDIDASRIFVTGLSAGGAMTSIMLATYPEVFAGGAVIAGLPYGAASSVGDAFSRMAGQGYPADAELAALVRAASSHDGPWPKVSVWHGTADATVSQSNADRIIAQWRLLHGLGATFSETEHPGGHISRSWRNESSQPVLEQHIITGMGHGTPLATHGPDGCGKAGPHMLEAGISSTRAIAQFWGLADKKAVRSGASAAARIAASAAALIAPSAPAQATAMPKLASRPKPAPAGNAQKGLGAVIEDALRAAGLMK